MYCFFKRCYDDGELFKQCLYFARRLFFFTGALGRGARGAVHSQPVVGLRQGLPRRTTVSHLGRKVPQVLLDLQCVVLKGRVAPSSFSTAALNAA